METKTISDASVSDLDQHALPERLVIGAATGYEADQIIVFLSSLQRSGYEGRVILFVDDPVSMARQLPARLLQGLDLKLRQPPRSGWLRYLLGPAVFLWLARRFVSKGVIDGIIATYAKPHLARFAWAKNELSECDADCVVVFADVRDVFFQAEFSKLDPGGALLTGEESHGYTLESDRVNRRWLLDAYGQRALDEIGNYPVLCSGVTVGRAHVVRTYIEGMLSSFQRLGPRRIIRKFYDQAFHNWLIRAGDVGLSVAISSPVSGPIFTAHGCDEGKFSWREGRVFCYGEHVPAIVHQLDRFPSYWDDAVRYFSGDAGNA